MAPQIAFDLKFYFLFLFNEGSMLETLDFTIRIGSTPTVSYFDLYLYTAYIRSTLYVYYI